MQSFKMVWKVTLRIILKLIIPLILLLVASMAAGVFSIVGSFAGNSSGIISLISSILVIAATFFYVYKSLAYSLGNFLLYDNPNLSSKEIVNESARLMKGNKIKYLLIGLYILLLMVVPLIVFVILFTALKLAGAVIGLILLLISIFLLLPYAYSLQVAFYNLIIKSDKKEVIVENNVENING